jgi:uncharacterized protein
MISLAMGSNCSIQDILSLLFDNIMSYGSVTEPTTCIFHGNNIDAFAAAYAIWKKWPNCKFIEGYDNKYPIELENNQDVLIVAFSYDEDVILSLSKICKSITVLDHHKVYYLKLQKLVNEGVVTGHFDATTSSCIMAWQYAFSDQEAPKLFQYIQDAELDRYNLDGTHEICLALNSCDYSFEEWGEIETWFDMYKKTFIIQGSAIDRRRKKNIQDIIKLTTRNIVIGGIIAPIANVPRHMSSEVATILAKDAPFAATYIDTPDGKLVSLRSTVLSNVDVSLIAAEYGGGGRATAAGFTIDIDWTGDVDIPKNVSIDTILTYLNNPLIDNKFYNPLIEYWKRLWYTKHNLKYIFAKNDYSDTQTVSKFAFELCPSDHIFSTQVETIPSIRGYADIAPSPDSIDKYEIHLVTPHCKNKDEFYSIHSTVMLKAIFSMLKHVYGNE